MAKLEHQSHQFRDGVARAIGVLRGERRWTQRELCRRTELSPAYLSELESRQKDASAEVLERIAAAFDVRMDEFLWVVLLGMIYGEVPGVERRDSARKLLHHVIGVDPASREAIEEFIEFQQWKQRQDGPQRQRTPRQTQTGDQYLQSEPDFTEDDV